MPVPEYAKDVPIGAKPKRVRKKKNTSLLLKQTDGPVLDQDEDQGKDEDESSGAEVDINDKYVPTLTAYTTTRDNYSTSFWKWWSWARWV